MVHETDTRSVFKISPRDEGIRLDVFLPACSNNLTRSRVQELIKSGNVTVNDHPSKPGYRLKSGDLILISIPPASPQALEPEKVAFNIVYEDHSLIVLNKPAGVVTHPAPGHDTGTLVHGLLQHCQDLSGIAGVLRPGIVHRLDKDTSGLMVVAKNDRAHISLSKQFKAGTVEKEYITLVHGRIEGNEGRIELPIGRHQRNRKEMSVVFSRGRRALTLWKKLEEFQTGYTLLSVSLKTGRTHQIRVHLSYAGHPVVGDPVYGYSKGRLRRRRNKQTNLLDFINRQMLHAMCLGFTHPDNDRRLEFKAPIPDDMERAVIVLRSVESAGI